MTPQALSELIAANATSEEELFAAYQVLQSSKMLPLYKNDKPVTAENPAYSLADAGVRTASYAEWKALRTTEPATS